MAKKILSCTDFNESNKNTHTHKYAAYILYKYILKEVMVILRSVIICRSELFEIGSLTIKNVRPASS